jgi:hypothetical protein
MQQWGVSYWETYSPVVNMLAVRLLLVRLLLTLCNTENFKMTDEGDVNKFLGVKITHLDNNSFKLSQPFLIRRILNFLGLCNNKFATDTNSSSTPISNGLLHPDLSGKLRKYSWRYGTAVGMLSYLQHSSRPKISMAVHQMARFSNNPMLSRKKSIMHIGHYPLDMQKRGII